MTPLCLDCGGLGGAPHFERPYNPEHGGEWVDCPHCDGTGLPPCETPFCRNRATEVVRDEELCQTCANRARRVA